MSKSQRESNAVNLANSLKRLDLLENLTNDELAELIATTPLQSDVQLCIRILQTRQRWCDEDISELIIGALAKRRRC
jgi:hypothetical protein